MANLLKKIKFKFKKKVCSKYARHVVKIVKKLFFKFIKALKALIELLMTTFSEMDDD